MSMPKKISDDFELEFSEDDDDYYQSMAPTTTPSNKRKLNETDIKDDSGREKKIQRGEEELKQIHVQLQQSTVPSSTNISYDTSNIIHHSSQLISMALIEEMLVPGVSYKGSYQSKYMDIKTLLRSIGPFMQLEWKPVLFELSKETNRQIMDINLTGYKHQEDWQYEEWILSPYGVDITDYNDGSEESVKFSSQWIHQFQHGLPIYYARNVLLYEQSPYSYMNAYHKWIIESSYVLYAMQRLQILAINFDTEQLDNTDVGFKPMIIKNRNELLRRLDQDLFSDLYLTSYHELRLLNIPTPGLVLAFENNHIPIANTVTTLIITLDHENSNIISNENSDDEEEEEEKEVDDDATIPYTASPAVPFDDGTGNSYVPTSPSYSPASPSYSPSSPNYDPMTGESNQGSPQYIPASPGDIKDVPIEIDRSQSSEVHIPSQVPVLLNPNDEKERERKQQPIRPEDISMELERTVVSESRFTEIQSYYNTMAAADGTVPIDASTLYIIKPPTEEELKDPRLYVLSYVFEELQNIYKIARYNAGDFPFLPEMFYKIGTLSQVEAQKDARYKSDPNTPLIPVTDEQYRRIYDTFARTIPQNTVAIEASLIYRVKTEEEEQKELDDAHPYHWDISKEGRTRSLPYWTSVTNLSLLLGYDNKAEWAIMVDRLLSDMPQLKTLTITQCHTDWIANQTCSTLIDAIANTCIPPFIELEQVSIKANIGIYTLAELFTHTRILRYTADENRGEDGDLVNELFGIIGGVAMERDEFTVMPNLHTLQLTWRNPQLVLAHYIQMFQFWAARYMPKIREVYICLIQREDDEVLPNGLFNETITLEGHTDPTLFYIFQLKENQIAADGGWDSGELSLENDNGAHNDGLRFEHTTAWPTRPGVPLPKPHPTHGLDLSIIDEEYKIPVNYQPDLFKPVAMKEISLIETNISKLGRGPSSGLPFYLYPTPNLVQIQSGLEHHRLEIVKLIAQTSQESSILQLNRLDRIYSNYKLKILSSLMHKLHFYLYDLRIAIEKIHNSHLDDYKQNTTINYVNDNSAIRIQSELALPRLNEPLLPNSTELPPPTAEMVADEQKRLRGFVLKRLVPSIPFIKQRMSIFKSNKDRMIYTDLSGDYTGDMKKTREQIYSLDTQIKTNNASMKLHSADKGLLDIFTRMSREFHYQRSRWMERYFELKVKHLLYDDEDCANDTQQDRDIQLWIDGNIVLSAVERIRNELLHRLLDTDTDGAAYINTKNVAYVIQFIGKSILERYDVLLQNQYSIMLNGESLSGIHYNRDLVQEGYFNHYIHYEHYLPEYRLKQNDTTKDLLESKLKHLYKQLLDILLKIVKRADYSIIRQRISVLNTSNEIYYEWRLTPEFIEFEKLFETTVTEMILYYKYKQREI